MSPVATEERSNLGMTEVSADQPRVRPAAQLDYSSAAPPPSASQRLVSLDAFRGFVMVLMVSAGLRIPEVVRNFERSPELAHLKTPLWERMAFHTDHTAWVGCSLWDLIQPSFMFMVGAAMAFSIASRRAKGQGFGRVLFHAIVRSVVLVLLAILLTSNYGKGTEWVFTNVLAQIGLGYTFLFLLGWLKPRWQLAAAIGILVLYWGAFAVYPKPPAELNPASVGLPADWHRLSGFASHWEKNTNVAARFDHWFLNLFPQASGKPYEHNAGGYQTLNFVPSLATMLFGLLAGEWLRTRKSAGIKFGLLLGLGLAGLAIGWLLGQAGICPVVKRIWTPSWTIFSTGWVLILLSAFYLVIDIAKLRLWSLPLVVVGMNSIAIYCMSMMLKPWVRETMRRHFGTHVFDLFGKAYAPMVDAGFFLLFCWVICAWMYRKKVFVKI